MKQKNVKMSSRIPNFPKLLALRVLRAYKWAISPLFLRACRYVPSCSEYAMEAVERFGVVRGGMMAGARLLRCHPFVRGGYDPVVKVQRCCESAPVEATESAPHVWRGAI